MEIIGIIIVILAIVAHFVEGFAAFNLIQFFRGKETPLEKMAARKRRIKKETKSKKQD